MEDDVPSGLDRAVAELRGAYGLVVHRAGVGYGSFLDVELGPSDGEGVAGWLVWIEQAGWRIESAERVVAGSEDDALDGRVQALVGRRLVEVVVDPASMDAVFRFSDGLWLRTFSASVEDDMTFWHVFLPDQRVLFAESGPTWGLEPTDTQHALDWRRPVPPRGVRVSRPVESGPGHVEACAALAPLTGRRVRGARVDGGVLQIDLDGASVQVAIAFWRLEASGLLLVGSGDEDVVQVKTMEGRTVEAVSVSAVSLDLTLRLGDGLVLRTFSVQSGGVVHWVVILPNGDRATAGPGSNWAVAAR